MRNNNNFATVNSDFNDTFSYATFMWDHELQRGMAQDGGWHDFGMSSAGGFTEGIVAEASRPMEQSSTLPNHPDFNHERIVPDIDTTHADSSLVMAWNDSGGDEDASDERILKDYFAQTVVPPIIAQVETQSKWSSTRQMLITMSTNSSMVNYAILAFSDLLMKRTQTAHNLSRHRYYKLAKTELLRERKEQLLGKNTASPASFDDMLAVLFFLSYIDLLESRITNAHENLKEAYSIFQQISNVQSRTITRRLISWIRLLDARAATTGGEGLFLAEENDVLTQPSPSFTDTLEAGSNSSNHEASGETDIEDILFESLYQPGFVFFQKIQSFMGRISNIDPWHRSRGTVADETEVMRIADKISYDLGILWEARPPLMDYTLTGQLTAPHVSASLAYTLTRTFRTFFANYHASRIHLHRVAYKHLPLSPQTLKSIANIRNTAHDMVQLQDIALDPCREMLPVNMLWPLLMWGCEENDPEERLWITTQIKTMEKVATNANITAQVLSEVQTRQDALKQRVDVRTIMHEIFDSCFAIV
ncbi:hypothetical protein VE03_05037 [Pseudogymnoascus sp. 23342-1-I1]|nr:hypothetical protein VE03_05037 [Pseudogymnoascus sp. 23342-1-I1]